MLKNNSIVYYIREEIAKYFLEHSYSSPNLSIDGAHEEFLSSFTEPNDSLISQAEI